MTRTHFSALRATECSTLSTAVSRRITVLRSRPPSSFAYRHARQPVAFQAHFMSLTESILEDTAMADRLPKCRYSCGGRMRLSK